MGLGHPNDNPQVHEYVYDVANDGGAVASVVLSSKSSQNAAPLALGSVRLRVVALVDTAFVGGGASLQWGDGDSSTGIHAAEAVGALTLNALFNDNSDKVVVDANGGQIVVEVTGAPFTAGKLRLLVEVMRPTDQ